VASSDVRFAPIAFVFAMVCAFAHAQPKTPFPSDDAITKAAAKGKDEQTQVFDAPSLRTPVNSFPNIEVGKHESIDVEAIAKQYQAHIPVLKQDELFVFASFAMPKASLERMMIDAAKVGAVVVFRGFKNNSWKETAETIAALKHGGVNAVVNPNAFRAFKVNVVPVVVLAAPTALQQLDDEGCAQEREFVSAVGDVTLDYALERIAKQSTRFSATSLRYAKAIRGSL
jgi:conjugal transfer pilus assembly protein TrbC